MGADENARIMRELVSAIDTGRPVVLATVVDTQRSVPRRAGTKMLVYADGATSGTVGGGEMESRVVAAAEQSLRTGTTQRLTYNLVDPGRGDPGVCGGQVEIYMEPSMPPPTVFVAGAGHVGRAVVELSHWLGFRTVVTDDRLEEVTEEAVPLADVRVAGTIEVALDAATLSNDAAVVFVSRSVDYDVASIPAALRTPARYVGVMGSTRRWKTTHDQLVAVGIDTEELARVRAPIGHEIGAETVEEIALSIMAEVVEAFRGEAGG